MRPPVHPRLALCGSVALLSLATSTLARAECWTDGDGETRCDDDDDGYGARRNKHWKNGRDGLELELGAGFGGGAQLGGTGGTWYGPSLTLGLHQLSDFDKKSLAKERTPGGAWCAPVACFLFGLVFVPKGAFIGNEVGLDLRARFAQYSIGDGSTTGVALGLRPTFRVARDSRVRTASLVGALMPELGMMVRRGKVSAGYLDWTPYPLALRVCKSTAVEWDTVRLGVAFPTDGTRPSFTMGTGLSLLML